jgi:hypothetical protein
MPDETVMPDETDEVDETASYASSEEISEQELLSHLQDHHGNPMPPPEEVRDGAPVMIWVLCEVF